MIALLFAAAVVAQTPGPVTAGDLLTFCEASDPRSEAACYFYILGTSQGLSIGARVGHDKKHFCLPDDVSADDLRKHTVAYLKADLGSYPADKDMAALGIIGTAMGISYPCEIAPPCKDGKPVCQPWERNWPNGKSSIQKGDVVMPNGAIIRHAE